MFRPVPGPQVHKCCRAAQLTVYYLNWSQTTGQPEAVTLECYSRVQLYARRPLWTWTFLKTSLVWRRRMHMASAHHSQCGDVHAHAQCTSRSRIKATLSSLDGSYLIPNLFRVRVNSCLA